MIDLDPEETTSKIVVVSTIFYLFIALAILPGHISEGTIVQYILKAILYINLACLSVCLFVCLFVCLYPINVKTAEPIGPKFFVGHHVIPGKVYE